MTVALGAAPALAAGVTRYFTYIACDYVGATAWDLKDAAAGTSEQDAQCYNGPNVNVRARWSTNQYPSYRYSPLLPSGSNEIFLTVTTLPAGEYYLSFQGSHKARNAYPDSWSSFSSYG
jgi:hypothetical protein